jgi:hypothetical protein
VRLGSSTNSLKKFLAVYTPERTKRPAFRLRPVFGSIWSRILIEQESLTKWGSFTQKQRSRYPF